MRSARPALLCSALTMFALGLQACSGGNTAEPSATGAGGQGGVQPSVNGGASVAGASSGSSGGGIGGSTPQPAPAPLLRASGKDIVDASGTPVHLVGFGLGGWLMHEGYMIGSPAGADSPRAIRAAIEQKIGTDGASEFYARYTANYVTESDLATVAAWGFNSVRLPFNANTLMPPEQQPDAAPYVFDEAAFAPIDQLVSWATAHELYVILDMHAAPGAQSVHNIADSDGEARLWSEKDKYWPRTIELWKKLAQRYANSPWVIGYDLLNEPQVPGAEIAGTDLTNGPWTSHDNSILREIYVAITEALRAAGDRKLVFAEAGFWGLNFKDLTPPWDDNLVYTFHYYPPPTGQDWFADAPISTSFNPVFDLDVPMWHGETGEWRQDWIDTREGWIQHNAEHTAFMKTANRGHAIGWSWWTTKKLNRETQPWSCAMPASYSALLANWDSTPAEQAKQALLDMAGALTTDQCQLLPDLVTALGGAP